MAIPGHRRPAHRAQARWPRRLVALALGRISRAIAARDHRAAGGSRRTSDARSSHTSTTLGAAPPGCTAPRRPSLATASTASGIDRPRRSLLRFALCLALVAGAAPPAWARAEKTLA